MAAAPLLPLIATHGRPQDAQKIPQRMGQYCPRDISRKGWRYFILLHAPLARRDCPFPAGAALRGSLGVFLAISPSIPLAGVFPMLPACTAWRITAAGFQSEIAPDNGQQRDLHRKVTGDESHAKHETLKQGIFGAEEPPAYERWTWWHSLQVGGDLHDELFEW